MILDVREFLMLNSRNRVNKGGEHREKKEILDFQTNHIGITSKMLIIGYIIPIK